MFSITDGLTFDDVLLTPKYSDVESRSTIDLSVNLGPNKLKHPIIPANMKSIIGKEMALEVISNGGLAILHRFMTIEEQLSIVKCIFSWTNSDRNLAVSVGIKDIDRENTLKFYDEGVHTVCIDIAHGDSKGCVDMIEWIKKECPLMYIIAGNVATGSGATRLWKAGADVVKVGIGGGCFGAGTRVLMANGSYKNIEDVIIGDYVINMEGNSVKVLNALCTGIKKVSKLRTNLFYEDTYVTPDHRFWIGDLNSISEKTLASCGYKKYLDKQSKTTPKKSKYKWKEIGKLEQGVLLMPKNISFNLLETFEIVINKRTTGNYISGHTYEKDSVITPSYESGYLFGTFIGDGHAMCADNNGSHIGSVTWYFGKEEIDIANKLAGCINKIFSKEPKIEITENTINVVFYYKPLADYLFSFGKKTEKHLPIELLVNNKEYLQGLLDGLIDSDSNMSKDNRISFDNTSIKAIELFNIVHYLVTGFMPNSEKRKISVGGLENCNVENCNQPYRSRPLKIGKKRHTKDYQIIKVLNYEDIEIEIPV